MLFVFSDDLSCYGKSCVLCATRPIIFLPYFCDAPLEASEAMGPGSLNRLNPGFYVTAYSEGYSESH